MPTQTRPSLPPLSTAALPSLPGFPAGTKVQSIAFVSGNDPGRPSLITFQEPRSCQAILLPDPDAEDAPPPPAANLTLLLIPTANHEEAELAESVWEWVEPKTPPDSRQACFITLQAGRVIWAPGRAAIIAAPERLETLRHALLDFSFHEGEVRQIEQAIAHAWPELEADTPLAFHFDGQAVAKQVALAERFQQVIALRTQLVRINPVIHRPPLHPPTLAGQLTERLKERTKLVERIEFLSHKLEVFERVYDGCSQRCSDYLLSSKQTTLEWIIIVLLALETVVLLVDLLARKGI